MYTELAPRWLQFHVAPAMPALKVHHFGGYSETRYKELFTHVESYTSAVSLLESGEQRYIKAISNDNNVRGAGIAQWLERRTRD